MQRHCYFKWLSARVLRLNRLFLQSVKLLFFILAFAILYMSCLPCGDSQECNAKVELKITASEDHPQHSHESEDCTPFCTCSCCAASASFSPFLNIQTAIILVQSTQFLHYDVSFHSEVFSSIWQPPQLS